MIRPRRQWLVWLIYSPIAMVLLFLVFQNFTAYSKLSSAYVLLLLLAVVVGLNPIRHHYTYYSFLGGISLVTYVSSGLLPEILLSSLAIVVLILGSDMRFDRHYLYPLYLTMTAGASVLSAGGYQFTHRLLENSHFTGYQLIPLAVYLLVQILSIQFFSVLSSKLYLEEIRMRFVDKHLKFTLFLGTVMLPITYAMLYMYFGMGTIGLLINSIPYLIVTVGCKYYYRVYNHRQILLEVNRYSRRLSKKTKVQTVIDSFVNYLLRLFPVSQIAFGERNEEGVVVLKHIYEKGQKAREPKGHIVIDKTSPVISAMRSKEMLVCLKADEWQKEPIYEGDYRPESVVILPISIMSEEKGVLLVTHQHQGVYDKFFSTLIEVFYMYVQIILNNAHNFEMLAKSNFTDFLTGLPNYRGFVTYFNEVIEEGDFDSLSLIILDLDHFKNVNDKHGHEAGNEVLIEIAELLNQCQDDNELVARYGGEEFVVLLKDAGREKVLEIAEHIRASIEKHSCLITQSIQADGTANVKVTASIGVATYPDNCNNVYDLVKLTDDTMYTKSKQGGRNRVSEYKGFVPNGKI